MNTTTFATATDLEDRWRPLTPEESNRAEVLLGDASMMVRRRFRTLDDRIEAGTLDVSEVRAVVCAVVKRAMMTGGLPVTNQSDSAGPFSQSVTFANPMGNLYLTAEDIAFLSSNGTRVSSIRLTIYGQ